MSDGFKLPTDAQHVFISGMTGTGKTRAAGWQLSHRSYDKMPWVVLDFKRDDLIRRIEHIEEVRLTDRLPRRPGLYVIRPGRDNSHDDLVAWMWNVLETGRTGLWIDEGYMAGGAGKANPAWDMILTQGRSKRIPNITLTQRPAWLNRFVISEASVFQIFHLNGKADNDRIREFVPISAHTELERFHSHWYDVPRRYYTEMLPVPGDDAILETFHQRLKPRRRII